MTEARPYASLSSGLLARKGAAKPAMRPQAFGQVAASLDDLGWNDMGEGMAAAALPEHVPSSIAALTPSPRIVAAEPPAVLDQRRAIAESFETEDEEEALAADSLQNEWIEAPAETTPPIPAPEPAAVIEIPHKPRRSAIRARDKSAFTLRLDPERHFRLRLACAVTGRSAQQIVTGALDEMLKTFPEVDTLAGHIPAKARARR